MRDSDGIKIKKAIFHLIEDRNSGGRLIESERLFPTSQNKAVCDYMVSHVRNSLADEAARSASFTRAKGADNPFALCTSALSGTNLVTVSRKLAKRLHGLFLSDKRLSPGALAVFTYKSTSYPGTDQFLAILKLDPTKVFEPHQKKDASGKRFISFKQVDNVVPSAQERLQKCAFIRPNADGVKAYDMMILDRQLRDTSEAAQFFTQKFLDAELFADPRTLTASFYQTAIGALNEVRSDLNESKAAAVRTQIDAAVTSRKVKMKDWTDALPVRDSVRKTFVDKLKNKIPDASFDVDPDYGAKLIRKRKYKGRYGFRMTVDAIDFDQVVESSKPKTDPDGGTYQEIILRVRDYEEVK